MVDVAVTRAFIHEGRAFQVGDTMTVAPITAAVLHRRGVVSLTKLAHVTKQIASAVIEEPRPRRRTYRRRALVAE